MQAIQRLGNWLHQANYTSYLVFFKPEAVYSAAGWSGAVSGDLRGFWHERFYVNVSDSLICHVYPFLPWLRMVRASQSQQL